MNVIDRVFPAHRSRPDRPAVLVLGGTGFIGRHAVAALSRLDCRIVVGSRHPDRRHERLPPTVSRCERRETQFACRLRPDDWRGPLSGIDVVINCVGILRPRGRDTYDRIHHRAPAALAAACRDLGLRLIHVSALGLDQPLRSRFLRSKRDGEAAIRRSGADWQIVRPSLLDGDGGFGARWLRRVAGWPVHPVPADAAGRIAVLDVRDLGEALARLAVGAVPVSRGAGAGAGAGAGECEPGARECEPGAREYDLGGLHARTLAEHLLALRQLSNATASRPLPIPGTLARLGSHLCDLLHLTPYSYGHWELLRRDNCPLRNRLPELLGRAPRQVGPGDDAAPVAAVRRPGSPAVALDGRS